MLCSCWPPQRHSRVVGAIPCPGGECPIVTPDAAIRFAKVRRIAKTVRYRRQIARAEPNVITDEDDPKLPVHGIAMSGLKRP